MDNFFVEIGCWQGEHLSQTAELERQGWAGVCVDPFPTNFDNRKCKVISKAVSKDGNPRVFIKVTKDRRHGGDVSYFSGFIDAITFHWPVIQKYCDYETVLVETVTFEQLNLPDHINFLSVDTEGSEFEIISSIDFKKYSFDKIMYEHNGVANGVNFILQKNGYKLLHHLELDDIYIKS